MRHSDQLHLVLFAIQPREKSAALKSIGMGIAKAVGPLASRAGGMLRTGLEAGGSAMEGAGMKLAPKLPGMVGTGSKPFTMGGGSLGIGGKLQNWGAGKAFDMGGGMRTLAADPNMGRTIARGVGKQVLNPFSTTSMSGLNPLQMLPGVAGSTFNLPGTAGRLTGQAEAGQEIANRAATQLPDMLANVPLQTRLAYLMNPGMFRGQITPQMLQGMLH